MAELRSVKHELYFKLCFVFRFVPQTETYSVINSTLWSIYRSLSVQVWITNLYIFKKLLHLPFVKIIILHFSSDKLVRMCAWGCYKSQILAVQFKYSHLILNAQGPNWTKSVCLTSFSINWQTLTTNIHGFLFVEDYYND